MDFLIWNATPAYKGNQPQPARAGLLAGLGSLLGGGGAPAYKTVGGTNAQASASSSSWWPTFSAAPVYKTASPSAAVDDAIDLNAPSPDEGDDTSDPTCVCDDQATQVVIL